MKFAIDIGHNAPVADTGAVGVKREDELTKLVGKELIEILIGNKHVVVETAPKFCSSTINSLQYRVETANDSQADIFVSIHFNAANFRAFGSEIYAISKAGRGIAREILDEIVKLGFYNRGVKRAPFYVLKHTTMPAVLVECCFCDSTKDMELFDYKKMANAIATGLIGELPENNNQMRTMCVHTATWLKPSTDQAKYISPNLIQPIKPGKYQLLYAAPSEEGHHFIKLVNGEEKFIYAGHCQIN